MIWSLSLSPSGPEPGLIPIVHPSCSIAVNFHCYPWLWYTVYIQWDIQQCTGCFINFFGFRNNFRLSNAKFKSLECGTILCPLNIYISMKIYYIFLSVSLVFTFTLASECSIFMIWSARFGLQFKITFIQSVYNILSILSIAHRLAFSVKVACRQQSLILIKTSYHTVVGIIKIFNFTLWHTSLKSVKSSKSVDSTMQYVGKFLHYWKENLRCRKISVFPVLQISDTKVFKGDVMSVHLFICLFVNTKTTESKAMKFDSSNVQHFILHIDETSWEVL